MIFTFFNFNTGKISNFFGMENFLSLYKEILTTDLGLMGNVRVGDTRCRTIK